MVSSLMDARDRPSERKHPSWVRDRWPDVPCRRGVRASPGFTLVELMVALLIGGLVALAVHEGVRVVWNLEARAQDRSAASGVALGARMQLREWLRGIPPPGSSAARSREVLSVSQRGGHGEALVFLTLAPSPSRRGLSRVRLSIRPAGRAEGGGLVAVVTDVAPPGHADTLLVVPGASRLRVRYLASSRDTLRWTRVWTRREVLPEAIELQTYGASIESLSRLPVVVRLRDSG